MASLEQRLQDLEESELFAPDFPERRPMTHAQWAGLSEEERLEARSPQAAAIRRATNARAWTELVVEMGHTGQARAVPTLARIWAECALMPVRTAAGHALRAIGSDEARAALAAFIDDAEMPSTCLAVLAVFDADADTAFDRFAPYFDPSRVDRPGGCAIPSEVLRTFGPAWNATRRPEEPDWIMSKPHWFDADERWMDLCISLRCHKQLGHSARAVLRLVEPERFKNIISKTRAQEKPRSIRWQSVGAGDLVTRYCRGEHQEVWSELRRHEAINADCRLEANAVATETMLRVARCADQLADRLAVRGWIALSGRSRWAPSAAGLRVIQDIEQFVRAPLPPSLRAFWMEVGGIDLVWNYNKGEPPPDLCSGLTMVEMDPLYVCPPEQAEYLLSEWADRRSDVDTDLDDPWNVDLAPDQLHKANISGGQPYGIELPYHGADPVFANEEHGLPFVEYLRFAFRWAGFPRLERLSDNVEVRTFVADMSRGLEPF